MTAQRLAIPNRILLLLALLPSVAGAAEFRVVFVYGDVVVAGDPPRSPMQGEALDEDSEVQTGVTGILHLRRADHSLVAIPPLRALKLRALPPSTARAEIAMASSPVRSAAKSTLRALSSLVGSDAEDKVFGQVATLGARGNERTPSPPYALSLAAASVGPTDMLNGVASSTDTDWNGGMPRDFGTLVVFREGPPVQSAKTSASGLLSWGRWTEGRATQSADPTDDDSKFDLEGRNLYFVQTRGFDPGLDAQPALPIQGTASFDASDLVGTALSDAAGSIGRADLLIDFGSGDVTLNLDASLAGHDWSAIGDATLDRNGTFGGAFGSVTVDGQTAGAGQFAGFAFDAYALSSGAVQNAAGVSVELEAPVGEGGANLGVAGALAFEQPAVP